MTILEVAQLMLDKQGYFVVFARKAKKIGSVESRLGRGYLDPKHCILDSSAYAQYVIVAEASREDVLRQFSLIGVSDPPHFEFAYRAIAE